MLGLTIVIAALLVVVIVFLLRVRDPHHDFMLDWIQWLDIEHQTGTGNREEKPAARARHAS